MEELRQIVGDALNRVNHKYPGDFPAIKAAVKNDLSTFLYKKTKRSPMILPVIMEV